MQTKKYFNINSSVITGVLLGLSFPTYPFIHLEFLAWFAFVPLLDSIKHSIRLGDYFKKTYLALFIWTVVSVWWVSTSTLFHGWSSAIMGLLMYFAQSLFSFIPFLVFYFIKKRFPFKKALLSFPFVWVSWEWIYMQLDASFPWTTLGNSHSNLIWLIQYADLIGVYGVSFWIVTFNVIFYFILDGKRNQLKVKLTQIGYALLIMLSPPLIYAYYIHINQEESDPGKSISVSIIQPNINPYDKWNANEDSLVFYYKKIIDSTAANHPIDLVVLPETAIPGYHLLQNQNNSLHILQQIVTENKIALLLGFADIKYFDKEYLRKTNFIKEYEFYNSSLLLTYDQFNPQVYHKMKLVPFAERVPYMDIIPLFSKLTVSIAGISSWGKGNEIKNFNFSSRHDVKVSIPGIICYESIYPSFVSDFVLNGANALSVITNDGWFLKTYGPYQHAAFSRLRAIENRRDLVRCANTGISFFVDSFGRVYGEKNWWEKAVTTETIALHTELTFFTQYPDMFPIFCLIVSTIVLFSSFIRFYLDKIK